MVYLLLLLPKGAWDKREINFGGEGVGNRKAYKDSHFTWTCIQFCTLIVTAGFWVRYFELFPSVFLFVLDWSWKNLVRNIIGPFIRKKISCWEEYTSGNLCILRNGAIKCIKRIDLRGMHKLTLIVNNPSPIFVLKCNVLRIDIWRLRKAKAK